MSACLTDPRILSFTLGVFTVVALRWNSLPQDVATLQSLASYGKRLLGIICSRKVPISEHMSSTEHFPRPPRTPTPTAFHFPPEVGGVVLPDSPMQSADAQDVTDTPEKSAPSSDEEEEDAKEDADAKETEEDSEAD